MSQITFIAPLPAFAKRTRLAKMLAALRTRNTTVRFYGWERVTGELAALKNTDPDVVEKTILRGGGYASGKARLMYPVWMIVVFWRVLLLGRGKVVFCLGWETAFPARLAATFTGAQIVFDDADRFSMILKLPGPLHKMLQRLEHWTSRKCALHIVPGMARYSWLHDTMLVLRNAPLTVDFEAARAAAPARPDHALVLYANGWLGQTRGAPVLLAALNGLQARGVDVAMIIAGRVDSPDGEALIAHPLVTYLGEVTQTTALAQYPAADVTLTLYDPAVPINRLAESNKWGDCVFFDTPFIVNAEVSTAQNFADAGACWQVPYHDTDGMVDLLSQLADPAIRAPVIAALANFKDHYAPFDQQLANVFDRANVPGWKTPT